MPKVVQHGRCEIFKKKNT